MSIHTTTVPIPTNPSFTIVRSRCNQYHARGLSIYHDSGTGDNHYPYNSRTVLRIDFKFKTIRSKHPYRLSWQTSTIYNEGNNKTTHNESVYFYIDESPAYVKRLYKQLTGFIDDDNLLVKSNTNSYGFLTVKLDNTYGEPIPEHIKAESREITLIH